MAWLDETNVQQQLLRVNSLVPGQCGSKFKSMIFKLIIKNSSLATHYEIVLRWIPQNLTDEKPSLV